MKYIIISSHVVTFLLVCTQWQCEAQRLGAQVVSGVSPIANLGEHKGKEILGPGFGEYIFISEGAFTMGCESAEQECERKEHIVKISPFFVGRTPLTNLQFVAFLNDAHITPEEYLCSKADWANDIICAKGKWVCSQGAEGGAASTESWILSERYCEWLSKKTGRKCRLPTEAEWEFVCRGKEGRKFPWGNESNGINDRVWGWRGFAHSKKIPVGSFPKGATPKGVCDLVGYMDEACSDWYDPEYYKDSPKTNPKGPIQASEQNKNAKVTRGGFERRYTSQSPALKVLRDSQFFGILPNSYLPRGWSRSKATPPDDKRFVNGRIGLRVVVGVETSDGDSE